MEDSLKRVWVGHAIYMIVIVVLAISQLGRPLSGKDEVEKKPEDIIYGVKARHSKTQFPVRFDVPLSEMDKERGFAQVCLYRGIVLQSDDGEKTASIAERIWVCKANEDGTCPPWYTSSVREDMQNWTTNAPIKGRDRSIEPKSKIERKMRDTLNRYEHHWYFKDKRTGKQYWPKVPNVGEDE